MFAVGRGLQEIIVDFYCLDARKPHPPVARNPIEFLEKMPQSEGRKPRTSPGCVDSEVSDVNAREDNFSMARIDEPSNLLVDVLW